MCGQSNASKHCLDENIFRLLGFELFATAKESKQIVANGAKPAKGNSLQEKEEEVSEGSANTKKRKCTDTQSTFTLVS